MSLNTWLGFFLASILIAVTPGPGAVLSMSTGMRHGYRVALRGILGLQLALALQVLVVAIGLGALLSASETAFQALRWCGALYLVWLGVQRWQAGAPTVSERAEAEQVAVFRQAVLVNMTNPKAILFICALLPQFVDVSQPLAMQYAVLALTLCLTDLVVMSGYALAARKIALWFSAPGAARMQNRLFGGFFVAAGAALAFSER